MSKTFRARAIFLLFLFGAAALPRCAAGHDRQLAFADFYRMDNGCTGLTNRFLNAAANECEAASAEEARLQSCVARRLGEACLAQNRTRHECALDCVQDIAHPDR